MMKKQIEICYSNSMKINRQNYEQEAPFYSAKTIIEENGQVVDEIAEFNRLRGLIDPMLTAQYNASKLDLSGVRVRVKDGKKYPSVTSILTPEKLTVPNIEKYCLKGTAYHDAINHFLKTGKWLPCEADIAPLKWDIDAKKFMAGHKFEDFELNIEIFHEDYVYSGEIDYFGKVDGVLTLLDWKTGSTWKLEQLVAYAKVKKPVQLAIAELKTGKLHTWKLTDKEVTKAWENFLIKRGEFKSRFGI